MSDFTNLNNDLDNHIIEVHTYYHYDDKESIERYIDFLIEKGIFIFVGGRE